MNCLIFIPFRLPQISCLTFSLKCLSSDSDNFPNVGNRPQLQFSHLQRAGALLLTFLLFLLVPSSYQVLHDSIYSLPLVRFSCLLSADVLRALCLKSYSWCIHGERCTPHPPTPLPSCSPSYQEQGTVLRNKYAAFNLVFKQSRYVSFCFSEIWRVEGIVPRSHSKQEVELKFQFTTV